MERVKSNQMRVLLGRAKWFWGLCLFLCLSCSDKIDKKDMYTFTSQTILDYLQTNPDLSDFAQIVEISKISPRSDSPVSALLNLYGDHTCFAPTNEAVKIYLDSVCGAGQYNVATLPQEIADEIVHNCVIEEKGLYTTKFFDGALVERTLNDKHLIVEMGDFGDGTTIRVNRRARVLQADIKVFNGYVHIVDCVVPQIPNTVPALINATDNLRIFARLLQATTWADSMLLYRDDEYEKEYNTVGAEFPAQVRYYPSHRLTGYIAFTETDSVFYKDWGVPMPVINPEDQSLRNWEEILAAITKKCQEAYPKATSNQLTSEDNAVNQFVSYHLLPFMVSLDSLFNTRRDYYRRTEPAYHIDHWDYTRPMGKPNRILKLIKTGADGIYHLNRHSFYDNGYDGTYKETLCDVEGIAISPNNGKRMDNVAPNGYFFPINHVLVYDDTVRNVVLNERLRYTVNMMVPELFSNRMYLGGSGGSLMTQGFLKSLKWEGGQEYQAMAGLYAPTALKMLNGLNASLTFPLLPVPYAGVWEIRYVFRDGDPSQLLEVCMGESAEERDMKLLGYQYTGIRELYFPPDPRNSTSSTNLQAPQLQKDQDLNYDSTLCLQYDKCLRIIGWMKGPKRLASYNNYTISSPKWRQLSARDWVDSDYLRCILVRTYMEPGKRYWIRFKEKVLDGKTPNTTAKGKTLPYEYVELVPKSVYDNPYKAEDIW